MFQAEFRRLHAKLETKTAQPDARDRETSAARASRSADTHWQEQKEAVLSLTNGFEIAPTGRVYTIVKRCVDIIISTFLLVLLFPFFLAVALAIFTTDRGPVFFFQKRTGKDGKPFRFFKFRTMVRNADELKKTLTAFNESTGPTFKMRRDPRVTPIGRWLRSYSVDELPQFINVLRGEMSLVGPRPLPVAEAARCTSHQQLRHCVQPGLLCFREVGGRSNLSFERWMELDLIYLQTRSFTTDLYILLRAIPAVLRGDGAY